MTSCFWHCALADGIYNKGKRGSDDHCYLTKWNESNSRLLGGPAFFRWTRVVALFIYGTTEYPYFFPNGSAFFASLVVALAHLLARGSKVTNERKRRRQPAEPGNSMR